MPRVYISKSSKPYKRYNPTTLKSAIEAYEKGNKSLLEISREYNISKSVLYRHATQNMKSHGGQQCISVDVEKCIVEYINICSEWDYQLNTQDLRFLVKEYLDRVGIEIKRFNDNLPGVDYIKGFLKRHNLEISKKISLRKRRSNVAVSSEIIENYFLTLKNSLVAVVLSENVNSNETKLHNDSDKEKVLTKQDDKYDMKGL